VSSISAYIEKGGLEQCTVALVSAVVLPAIYTSVRSEEL
jgi:hypothetical protein